MMMEPSTRPPAANAAPHWVAVLLAVFTVTFALVAAPALGRENPRTREAAASATPVTPADPAVADPLDGDPDSSDSGGGDPLDGDPLDGLPVHDEASEPPERGRLEIERSGRPDTAPRSVVAYDNDPDTVWALEEDAEESWIWLDLGDQERIRQVYWLVEGAGAIEVSVSSDRQRWTTVDQVETAADWQSIDLREDARYVRLELVPGDDGALPEIAEVAVFGKGGSGEASRAQDADSDRKRKRDRRDKADERSNQKAEKDDKGNKDRKALDRGKSKGRNGSRDRGETRTSSDSGISAQQGETSCRGNRERCRAREGKVTMEEECESEGTCTIDVNVDGGTALCDATGGSKSRAGDGEGRRAGEGGVCEAVADGGAVSIGDINP